MIATHQRRKYCCSSFGHQRTSGNIHNGLPPSEPDRYGLTQTSLCRPFTPTPPSRLAPRVLPRGTLQADYRQYPVARPTSQTADTVAAMSSAKLPSLIPMTLISNSHG